MEWRIFWCVDRENVVEIDIFSLLKARFVHKESPRTDIYIPTTNGVGIKLRGEKLMEVKVRTGLRDEIGAEKWDKVVQEIPSCKVGPKEMDSTKQYIKDLIKELIDQGTDRHQMEEALAVITSSSPIKFVNVYKIRRQAYQNCSIEQTYLDIDKSHKFFTISIEGTQTNIQKVLDSKVEFQGTQKVLKDVLESIKDRTCGYPEFVLQMC